MCTPRNFGADEWYTLIPLRTRFGTAVKFVWVLGVKAAHSFGLFALTDAYSDLVVSCPFLQSVEGHLAFLQCLALALGGDC